jgi:hypothetical protein
MAGVQTTLHPYSFKVIIACRASIMHADIPLARVREYFYGYVKKFKGLRSTAQERSGASAQFPSKESPPLRSGGECQNAAQFREDPSERLEKGEQLLFLNGGEFTKFPGHVFRLALVALDSALQRQ